MKDDSPSTTLPPGRLPEDVLRGGLPGGLFAVSCAYLVLPYVIFFLGWLHWWLAAGMTALLLAASYRTIRDLARFPGSGGLSWRQLAWAVGAAVALCLFAGMGGYGAPDSDHPKHEAVLRCLIEEPWPATVPSPEGRFPLVYYTAWYLPSAVVGKLAGWRAAHHFLFAWTLLGLALSIAWFCRLSRGTAWVVVTVFVLFSGLEVIGAAGWRLLDFLGSADFDGSRPLWAHVDWNALRWWNWGMRWWGLDATRNYSCNVSLLFFVPQQALAGWILTAIIAQLIARSSDVARKSLVFFFSLSSLWSPFVTLGLVPLVALDLFSGAKPPWRHARVYGSLANVCGLAVLGLLGLYFLSRFGEIPLQSDPGAGLRLSIRPGESALAFLGGVLVFYALEVGVLAWSVWATGVVADRRDVRLLVVVLALLLLLSPLKYGAFNDLQMRASIPSLFLLAVFVARAVQHHAAPPARRLILVGLLAVAAANPISEVYRHVRGVLAQGRIIAISDVDDVRTLWELNLVFRRLADEEDGLLMQLFHTDTFFRQYVGSRESLFFKHLARRPPGAGVVGAGPSKHNQGIPLRAASTASGPRHEREPRSVEQSDVVAPSSQTRPARPRPSGLASPGPRAGLRCSGVVSLDPGRRG